MDRIDISAPEAAFSYQEMSAADLGQVTDIESQITDFPWTLRNFESCLDSHYQCWVLRYQGNHVGHSVLSMVAGEAELLNISIAKGYQGLGLGRRLLIYMLGRAKSLNARAVFLEVRASNEVAQRLYESEGFNEVGVRPAYYPAEQGREDAVIMALEF